MADEFKSVRVVKAWDEGARLRALRLDLGGTGYSEKFTTPGQYVKARANASAKEAFMAIASAPGPGQAFELLVQKSDAGDTAADLLAAARAGDAIEMTAPGGKGFPVDAERGRDVLLLAGGSGISAIRSVLEHVARHREAFGRTMLLFGARSVDDLAYRHLFEDWRKAQIEVEPTLSKPEDGAWTGRRGYVTAAFADLDMDAPRTSVFVAGGKEFLAASTDALRALGIPPERIFKNF